MQAFHSFWSKPNRLKNNGIIEIPDYELLVLMLSALKWKSTNGKIKMITDSEGYTFFEENGLLKLWNQIDCSLDKIEENVDPFLFWAAGKLYALKAMDVPCVMLDTDMIIWENIESKLDEKVVAAHCEELSDLVYPNPSIFNLKSEYQFPKEWDFRLNAANTAFLYLPNSEFIQYYVHSALEFINSTNLMNVNPVVSMCFAEQRILPMCVKAKGLELDYLLDYKNLDNQNFVTHLWGYKGILASSYKESEVFCIKCVKRIIEEFPELREVILYNKKLRKYLIKYEVDKNNIL